MIDRLHHVLDSALHAARLIVDKGASVNPWLLALGTVLYLVSQAVRTRGWHAILRATYPEATQLRARNTCAAYLAGAGINGIVPARGGDVVKLYLVRRRVPEATWATLVATFLPETLFETAFGTGLVVWALIRGFLPVPLSNGELPALDVSLIVAHPILSTIVAGGLAFGTLAVVRWLRRRASAILGRVREGVAILGSPRRYLREVVPPQALARVIRLGALAAFMGAFSLPVTVTTTVLVMAAQGGGRIIPLAPASAGLRLAMLSYGFVEVTGQPVDIAEITVFTFGVGAVLMVAGLVVGLIALMLETGSRDPFGSLRALRYRMSTGVPTGTRG